MRLSLFFLLLLSGCSSTALVEQGTVNPFPSDWRKLSRESFHQTHAKRGSIIEAEITEPRLDLHSIQLSAGSVTPWVVCLRIKVKTKSWQPAELSVLALYIYSNKVEKVAPNSGAWGTVCHDAKYSPFPEIVQGAS